MLKPNHPISSPGIKSAARSVLFGVLINFILAAVKITSGIIGNSYALVADGVESSVDIVSSLIVWAGMRAAVRAPNERHPYGYGKAESLAAVAVSGVLVIAAIGIAIESVREIIIPHHAPAPFTLAVLVGVIIIKEALSRFVLNKAHDIGSTALRLDAWHHRADAITSAAAFIGISIALICGPGFESADDYAALFAAGVIGVNGIRLMKAPLRDILDFSQFPEIESGVRQIARCVPGVDEIEECRVRRSGLYLLVDIHVQVNGALSVHEGHEIARVVRRVLCQSNFNIQDALVHIEPSAGPGL